MGRWWQAVNPSGLFVLCVTLLLCGTVRGQLPDIPFGRLAIELESVVIDRGIEQPLQVTNAGDGSDRLFIAEKFGEVRIVDSAGALSPQRFLDLSAEVFTQGSRGLLGMTFHPGFSDLQSPGHRKFYTYHTVAVDAGATEDFSGPGASTHQNLLTEWQVDVNDPNAIDVTTRREIFREGHPGNIHSGGGLEFDADGYLNITIGTPIALQAQNLGNVLGTVLRIDPLDPAVTPSSLDPVSGNGNYRIPLSNPFLADGEALDEIFAYGFRHPYRMSIDPITQLRFVGDVGEAKIEEVDVAVAGGNYGWSYMEGTFPGPTSLPEMPPVMLDPIAQYDHDDGRSVIGGFVYRGSALPELEGKYVFGDLTTGTGSFFSQPGRLFYIDPYDELGEIKDPNDVQIREFVITSGNGTPELALLSFGLDEQGEIYIVGFGTTDGVNDNQGTVRKIVSARLLMLGDMDCDDDVDFDDIGAFVLGLTDAEAYEQQFGIPPTVKGDLDEDGDQDFDDIDGFVGVLSGQLHGPSVQAPEPGAFALLVLGVAGWAMIRAPRLHRSA